MSLAGSNQPSDDDETPRFPDRGKDRNNALAEMRTILSRSETALRLFEARPWAYHDVEMDEMRRELQEIVVRLSRWRRRW